MKKEQTRVYVFATDLGGNHLTESGEFHADKNQAARGIARGYTSENTYAIPLWESFGKPQSEELILQEINDLFEFISKENKEFIITDFTNGFTPNKVKEIKEAFTAVRFKFNIDEKIKIHFNLL